PRCDTRLCGGFFSARARVRSIRSISFWLAPFILKVSPTQERFASCLLAVNVPLKHQLLCSPCNFVFFLHQHALAGQEWFDISIQMDGNFGKRPFRSRLVQPFSTRRCSTCCLNSAC